MAIGDLASIIDSLEFESTTCYRSCPIRIAANVYAVAYSGPGTDGFLVTFTVSDAGAIGDTVIDTLEFDTVKGTAPVIFHRSGDVYAIFYTGDDYDGWLATVTIDSEGNIADTIIASLEFDGARGRHVSVAHVDGNIYAISYEYLNTETSIYEGKLKTVSISADGATLSVVDDTIFEDTYGAGLTSILHISGTVYTIVHQRYLGVGGVDSVVGLIRTINIADDGTIGALIDSTALSNILYHPKIVHLAGSLYAIVYAKMVDSAGEVHLDTVTITDAGVISSVLETQRIAETGTTVYPDIVALNASTVLVAYMNSGDNTLVTYSIDSAGLIGDTPIDTLIYDGVGTANYPRLIRIEDTQIYMVVHVDTSSNGVARTFGIALPTSYPSDAITRVTGIRHIYRPGFFRIQLMLGDVSNTIEIAEARVRKELEIPEDKTPEPPKVPIPPYEPGPYWAPKPPPIPPYEPGPGWERKEPEEELPPAGIAGIAGRAIVGAWRQRKPIWRTITPWEEEAGETFGTWAGRIKETLLGGLFKR